MFKIAKLNQVSNEKVTINIVSHQQCSYDNGKKVKEETFKTLSFDISGDNYSFSFDLNCRMEKLLEIPMSIQTDLKEYIFNGETWLNINDLNGIEPKADIKITRYLNNRFIIFITFYTEYTFYDDEYGGIVEFTFNLDDYL